MIDYLKCCQPPGMIPIERSDRYRAWHCALPSVSTPAFYFWNFRRRSFAETRAGQSSLKYVQEPTVNQQRSSHRAPLLGRIWPERQFLRSDQRNLGLS
jgi:hypothetical protein